MEVSKKKLESATGKRRKYIYESRYQQIAVELAQKIADGWYTVGEKISARSTLASKYNVSPETARKAVNILVDLGIVTIRQGSGTYVASREKAHLFVERYQNTVSMQEIRSEISECVSRQQEELDHLSKLLKTLVGQTKRS
ncbi:MAG: GntR family transcriptional regulator, partial [Eubacteriales bacterium]|nr:GntR family transcriptional regulator [Eubacteriales bacterium]